MKKEKNKKDLKIFWLGISSLFVVPFAAFLMLFVRKIFDPVSYNITRGMPTGSLGALLSLGLAIYTIILFTKSHKTVRKSSFSSVGFILAMLVGCFWIFIIMGALLFPH